MFSFHGVSASTIGATSDDVQKQRERDKAEAEARIAARAPETMEQRQVRAAQAIQPRTLDARPGDAAPGVSPVDPMVGVTSTQALQSELGVSAKTADRISEMLGDVALRAASLAAREASNPEAVQAIVQASVSPNFHGLLFGGEPAPAGGTLRIGPGGVAMWDHSPEPGGGGGGGGGLSDARLTMASFYCRGVGDATWIDPDTELEVEGVAVEFCSGYVRVSGMDRVRVGRFDGFVPGPLTVLLPNVGASPHGIWVKLDIQAFTGAHALSATASVETALLSAAGTIDGFPVSEITGYSNGWPQSTIIFPLVSVWKVYGSPQIMQRYHVGGDLVFGNAVNHGYERVVDVRYNPEESRMEVRRQKVSVIGGIVLTGEDFGDEAWEPMENGSVVPCPSESS